MNERETCRHAVTAMTWALLGFYFVPLLGTVLAFVYARRADRMIQRHPDDLRGSELAASARSLAKVQVVLILLLLAVMVGVFFAFADAVRDELERESLLGT